MSSSDQQTTTTRCPSCGAPIKMGPTRGTCDYCETVVERPADHPAAEPIVVHLKVRPTGTTKAASSSGATCGLVIGLLGLTVGIIVAVLAFVGGVAPGVLPGTGPRISDLMGVVPRDADHDDLVVFFFEDDAVGVGVVDGLTRAVRWRVSGLSSDARQGSVAVGADTVYVTDKERLHAYELGDGTQRWETSLTAEIPSGCDGCLQVVGGRLIAWQKDGSLQGFDEADGRLVWSEKLETNPRALPVVAGLLVTVGRAESGDTVVRLTDPADGSVRQELVPLCTDPSSAGREVGLSSVDELMPSADGSALLVLAGSAWGCAQRWEPGAARPAWSTFLDSGVLPFSGLDSRIVADEAIVFGQRGLLTAIDTATGELRSLVQDEEQIFRPLFARDGLLVVMAAPQWDMSKHTLWGIDLASGERRWQHALVADEWLQDAGFGEWDARPGPPGELIVVQVPEDLKEVSVERLDLRTGVSRGREVRPTGDVAVVWDNYWTERMGWLQVGSEIVAVDLRSGAVTVVSR